MKMKRNVLIIMLLGSFLMAPINSDAHSPKISVNVMTNDVSQNNMPVSKEIEELLKKAEQGDVESMYKLGKCYDKEKNYVEANKWYRKAAELGNGAAAYELGLRYYGGIGVEKNYEEANNWYRKGLKLGDGKAARCLGINYYNGNGVEKNPAEANKWYRKAVRLGDAAAARFLGDNYQNGVGVERDPIEARKWYIKSAELGDGDAAFAVGQYYYSQRGPYGRISGQPDEAVKWWKRAIELGNDKAAVDLAHRCFVLADGSLTQDEAVEFLHMAVEHGNGEAAYKLGEYYQQKGEYKNRDDKQKIYEEACKWYKKAVELGKGEAAYKLGEIYFKGDGVVQDYAEAEKWINKAIELGNISAATNVGMMFYKGIGVRMNYEEARKWWSKAAKLGSSNAAEYLAMMDRESGRAEQSDAELNQLIKKYGKYAQAMNQRGEILIGTPIQLITEYISYSKKYNDTARGAASFTSLSCTKNDILRFGRSVRKYKLNILGISQTLWATNGKVVAKSDAYLF